MPPTCAGPTARRCRTSRTAPSSRSTACASGSPARPTTTRRARRRPEDLKFLPTVATTAEQADAPAPRGRGFRRRGLARQPRRRTTRSSRTRTVDLLLSGHDHDLFINYDGRNAMVESSYDAHYVTVIDVTIEVKVESGRRAGHLVAAVPRHRHRDRHAGPRGRDGGGALRGASSAGSSTYRSAPPRSSSTAAADRAHARSRDRQPGGRRHADGRARRRRGDERRRHPRRQGLPAGHADHPARYPGRAAVRQPDRDDRDHRRRPAARDRERAVAVACSVGPVSAGIRHDGRGRREPPARQPRARRSRSATRRSTRARPTGSPPTISCCAAATATSCSATRRRSCRQTTPPLVSAAVMDYVQRLGTIRTEVDGRIVLK